MIYEYAIYPEFILELADKNDLLLSLYRGVGIGTPCIFSEYPKEAAGIVRKSIEDKLHEAKEPKEKAKLQNLQSKTTEIMKKLWSSSAKRHGTSTWTGTFGAEHARHPFQGILAPSKHSSNPAHKDLSWLRSERCELLSSPMMKNVRRTASDLGEALRPLLQNASQVMFIDPYFGAEDRFKNAYKVYFDIISKTRHVRGNNTGEIDIICVDKSSGRRSVPEAEFQSICEEFFQAVVPADIKINIYRVKERPGEQEFHNRYILTNIGGVMLGHGTDESENSTNSFDDISILPADILAHWKKVYTHDSPNFVWPKMPICSS